MTRVDRDTVLSALRAEDVANHLGIKGAWRGRWMRSARCGAADHPGDAFGLSRDGRWHCFACDTGGDLLKLIAIGEGLDVRVDFDRVLTIAAAIAGVDGEEDFTGKIEKPAPRARPPAPEIPPLNVRISEARRRAAWVWHRLTPAGPTWDRSVGLYLAMRKIGDAVFTREHLRGAGVRLSEDEKAKAAGDDGQYRTDLGRMVRMFAVPGVALPVRHLVDGELVDVRIRRYEPKDGQPKIIGMLGGITTGPAENGRPRQLIGCYGHPEAVDSDTVVIVEGAMDYLTALCVWPNAQVLGAVDAGSLSLVAAHAARALAQRDNTSRLLIVEQNDPPRKSKDGVAFPGAADASINEDPNSAAKKAISILGPRRVGWLFCDNIEGAPAVKDLNDLVRFGGNPASMVRWWSEVGQ